MGTQPGLYVSFRVGFTVHNKGFGRVLWDFGGRDRVALQAKGIRAQNMYDLSSMFLDFNARKLEHH